MSATRRDAMAEPRTARPDVRLAVPALSAWAGAFIATSGRASGGPLVVICLLVTTMAALASSRGRWAMAACSLALLAGLGMGALRWAGLHVEPVDQLAVLAQQRASRWSSPVIRRSTPAARKGPRGAEPTWSPCLSVWWS